ncbi:MAG: glycosyltransferase family 4 protein [Propionivibrio sp.]|uniref:glycosyltransferase family 4 protein n=1 Tax=Propionivibrio sp. TaxID=2212460 RepID=UPI001B76E961|nr:glycosyltransferase family 4 protein [Propionivibrio sp.]MBP7203342.1 glycosyltransferase family 4 protein [Propionivibrio sp.]MBP8214672.1 glycosyltransferase family 4 protein [Propionivibrio sp.]
MIRTLLFSTLYPSSARPIHGIFVETRLRELLKSGEVETKVVAPVPWFPFSGERWGEYGRFAATPRFEQRNGVDVHHPRYFLPPKIGMNIAPHTLARSALPTIRKLMRDGFDFDLIDAHYYYPDGVAAGFLAKWLGKPFVVTARGTDLSQIPQFAYPRRLILDTAARAAASIGVCAALMDSIAELGADRQRLHVMRNGVDLERFQPVDRVEARRYLGLPIDRRILLSVGLLIERKGHHIAIEALKQLPEDVLLVIAGSGPERERLEGLAKDSGVAARVQFAGQVPNDQLKWWYSAADALLLCSSREGWANVLLESMACGTPAIATSIWGTPEVIQRREAGRLMATRTPQALVDASRDLFADYPDRTSVRKYAEGFGWDATTAAQLKLFKEVTHA